MIDRMVCEVVEDLSWGDGTEPGAIKHGSMSYKVEARSTNSAKQEFISTDGVMATMRFTAMSATYLVRHTTHRCRGVSE